ncbi:MAG: ABC transporter permease, partial [Gemmatimonadales bacterium]
MTRPPAFARRLLRWTLPDTPAGWSIAGDLEEEWSARRPGLARNLWYLAHAARIATRYGVGSGLGIGLLGRDLRTAFASWRSSPRSVLLAVLALALGVGANTAVFSVLRGVVLAPLRYERPQDLSRLWDGTVVSKSTFEIAVRVGSAFSGIAAAQETRQTLLGEGRDAPESLLGLEVSPGHLGVLGVRPAIGRDFRPDESVPGNDRVVILSDGLWRRRFGADPAVLGRTIVLGGPRTVIGVMSSRHDPIRPAVGYWLPMAIDRDDVGDYANTAQVTLIGRRKSGLTADAAQADLTRIARAVRAESNDAYPDSWVREARVAPLLDSVVGSIGPTLWALQAAVLLVLLAAMANVATLLVVRAAGRRTELTIRSALGASRRRLVRQLVTESAALGLLGGLAGLAIAGLTLGTFRAMLPAETPRIASIGLDPVVVGFAVALSLVAGAIAGAMPALRLAHDGAAGLVRASRCDAGRPGSARLQLALVAGEIAMATVLAVVTALVLQSGWRAGRAPLGFDPESVLTVRMRPSAERHPTDAARLTFYGQAEELVRGLPGVRSVGMMSTLPLETTQPPATVFARPDEPAGSERRFAHLNLVFPGTFAALGMSVSRGRALDESDRDGPPVVVVNEALARATWGSADVVGRPLLLFGGDRQYTVVGVVADLRVISPETPAAPAFYLSYQQQPWWPTLALVVRTANDPVAYAASIQRAIWSLDPTVPLEIAPLRSQVRSARAEPI